MRGVDYIEKIFERAKIQQLCSFLLYGVEDECDARSYRDRLDVPHNKLTARLHKEYPDMGSYEEITALVYEYATALESVYMEIGLKIGTTLTLELLRKTGAESQ